ncbi:MAG: DUF6526 family protein [Longimicrobiales bacterium]
MSATQSAASHAKIVPVYHYVGFGFVAIPTFYSLYLTITQFSLGAMMMSLFAIGVIVSMLYARLFPLGVQDRVIRLEERMRMERLLPAEMHARIGDVATEHLIALRFASDDELVDLTKRILDGEFSGRKGVKEAIKNWRADHQRI